MKIRYFIAAATFAFIANTSAQAADIVRSYPASATPAAASAPSFNWQGFYIGGEIGGSWARSKVHAWDAWDYTRGVGFWSVKPDGFIGGVYAGYNFYTGDDIILGIDTDFLWNDIDGTDTQAGVKVRVKQKWAGSTRLRIGYAVDRWLPYFAGGVAYARIRGGMDILHYSEDKTRAGWTIGAGADYAMTDNVLLRLEYRYTDFGEKSYYFADAGANYRIKYNTNDFRVGVAYKF